MFVKVMYYKPWLDGFGGREYVYQSNLPLRPGDIVIAPTEGGDQRAFVTTTFAEGGKYDFEIKSITQYEKQIGGWQNARY